jgi:hypothetical protein
MVGQTVLAELAAFAEKCDFPCTKQDLIDTAEDIGAPDEVMDILDRMPDKNYLSETDVVSTAETTA